MTRTQKIRALRAALKEFERGVKMAGTYNEYDIENVLKFIESYNSYYAGQREEEADEVLRNAFSGSP